MNIHPKAFEFKNTDSII